MISNGLDFMNMIYCVPWSKSIKGILCSSLFLHHYWAEGACTYHFTIRLLICNAILFVFFLSWLSLNFVLHMNIQDPFAFKHSQTGIHLYGRKLYIQGGFEKNLINLGAHYWVANLQLIRWRNLSCIVIECKNHVFKLDM